MENTLERIAESRYKTKMNKRSGFGQVNLIVQLRSFWRL